MSDEILSPRVYFKTFGALAFLLLLTVGVAYLDLGAANLPIAMAISIVKTALIVLLFMHLRWSEKLLHLAAFAGVLFLAIMLLLTLGDYASRGWLPVAHR